MMQLLVHPLFKQFSLKLGVYQLAREIYRRVFNTKSAHRYKESIKFYKQILPTGSLCFDVDAHIGEKTEIFLELGMEVVAFEPQPECVEEIRLRCKSKANKLVILQQALGSKSGFGDLYLSPISNKSSFNPNWVSVSKDKKLNVEVITLDQAILKHGYPYYCKIDAEGYELEILTSLTSVLSLVSFEYHMWTEEIQKTIECVQYISRIFEQVEINITPAEELRFIFPQWISVNQFLAMFPEQLKNKESYQYGDVFVRKFQSD